MASVPSTRWALVTGGARRLGAAFALDLAKRGWNLWIHYHTSVDDARKVADAVQGLGRLARVVQADLGAPGGVESLVARLGETPPVLVVHSASAWVSDTSADARADVWESSHRLHVWSAVVLARALALWSKEETGHLLTLLDSRLRDKDPGHFSYAFAKRELALLTRYLADELAPGVRVNGLAPGLILRSDSMPAQAWRKAGRESTPLARTGKTADLLRAFRYLVDSPFVTGQILTVDGGRHLKGDLFGSI